MEKILQGAILIIIAMLIFGSFGIFSRAIDSPVLVLVMFFQIVGLFGMGIIVFIRKTYSVKGQLKLIACYVAMNLIADMSFLAAVRYTSVANAVFLKYTGPIYVLLLAPLLLKETRGKKIISALVLAIAGLLIILYQNISGTNAISFGIVLGIISGLTLGIVTIIIKKILTNISVYTAMFYRFLISTPIMIIVVVFSGAIIPMESIAMLLFFGAIFAVVGTAIHLEGVARVSAQRASILFYIEPLAAVVFAIILLSETPTLLTLIGGLLIILSSYIMIKK